MLTCSHAHIPIFSCADMLMFSYALLMLICSYAHMLTRSYTDVLLLLCSCFVVIFSADLAICSHTDMLWRCACFFLYAIVLTNYHMFTCSYAHMLTCLSLHMLICSYAERFSTVILYGHNGSVPTALKRLVNQDEVERLIHLSTLHIDCPTIIKFQ